MVLPEGVERPYDWALKLLRVHEAHAVTRGGRDVIVAVIDLGYTPHPDHEGHLHADGWDFADDDASLEYTGCQPSDYMRDHHCFIVGEVAAVAPECPIMVLRVGYDPEQGDSWWRAIDHAVEHGARAIVMPHGYLQGQRESGQGFFYRGTDFGYPFDNLELKRALDRAYQAGCVVCCGVADNRGRRALCATSAFEAVMAVGSCDRRGQAADIAPSSDDVEVAAPAGNRHVENPVEKVWGTAGNGGYVPFVGGCMAAGFAGGVAALVMSRYPQATVAEVRQMLRNTAAGEGWDAKLGHGVLDAAATVSLRPEQLQKRLALGQARRGEASLRVMVRNLGVHDLEQVMVTVYNGNPNVPADGPELTVRQLGHARAWLMGLEGTVVTVDLPPGEHPELWVQAFVADVGAPAECVTERVS